MEKVGKYTPEMLAAMSQAERKAIVKAMTIELVQSTAYLTKKDIASWRMAWQLAINPNNPQRGRLYDVYRDVEIDLHLTGAMGQRKGMTTHRPFKIVDKKGKESADLKKLFEAEWFSQFVEFVLDSVYYGHSLIELGDVIEVEGILQFESVSLVPRHHVVPEFGVILKQQGDEISKGISYREGAIKDWCIEAGDPRNLGLLLKVSPSALSKKNMLSFWDAFGEMFGMPIRIGKTTSRDEAEISKVERMLSDMGAASWGLFPDGTEIEIKETTRGDAYNVYDKRIERANSEMSKGVLMQTMTIDNGSSLSQSEVHLEVFENVVQSDANFLRNIINGRLIPIMIRHGFPLKGYSFVHEQLSGKDIEEMLLRNGYDIDPDYFAQKYNIPIKGRSQPETSGFFE